MAATKITIRVVTVSGTNASEIGSAHSWDGTAWRNSVDNCDSDGCGRVLIDCDNEEVAIYVEEQLESDDRVSGYDRM